MFYNFNNPIFWLTKTKWTTKNKNFNPKNKKSNSPSNDTIVYKTKNAFFKTGVTPVITNHVRKNKNKFYFFCGCTKKKQIRPTVEKNNFFCFIIKHRFFPYRYAK